MSELACVILDRIRIVNLRKVQAEGHLPGVVFHDYFQLKPIVQPAVKGLGVTASRLSIAAYASGARSREKLHSLMSIGTYSAKLCQARNLRKYSAAGATQPISTDRDRQGSQHCLLPIYHTG